MDPFEKWLEAKEHDAANLTAEEIAALRAQYDAELAAQDAADQDDDDVPTVEPEDENPAD